MTVAQEHVSLSSSSSVVVWNLTAFEYISIPVSIVLALGMGKILSAISHVFRRNRRDWVLLLWCITLIAVMLIQWVAVWQLKSNEQWSAGEFLLLMISPLIYYSAAHILISSNPESIESWAEHLADVSRPLLSLMLLALCNYFLRSFVIIDEFTVPPFFAIVITPIALLNLAAIAFPKRWLLACTGAAWLIPAAMAIGFVQL